MPNEYPGLEELHRYDPGFNDDGFLDRAFKIIEAIRLAEASGDWEKGRHQLSSRFFRRWQPWVASLEQGRVKQPAVVSRQLTPIAGHSEAAYDQATLRVVESGDTPGQAAVTTVWTFLRSATGRKHHQRSEIATVCTSCAAPVEATNQPACRYCRAALATLGPNWIVDDVAADSASSAAAA